MPQPDKTQPKPPSRFFTVLESGLRVDIEDEARRLAHANLPESGATDPTEVETAVIRQASQDHVRKAEQTNTTLHAHSAAFHQIEQRLPSGSDLDNHVHHVQTEAEAELAGNPELGLLRKDERSALRTLRIFLRENRLKRDAHFPASSWMHYGIVVAIATVELIGNAVFFAEGNPLGLSGGLLVAFLLVVFNVGLGYFVGKTVVPNRNHIDRSRRLRANLLMVLYLLVIVGTNLMVAHYRDLCLVSQGTEGDVAGKLIRGPFDLTFHSMLLFLLGILASVLTVWKSFKSDDPYPHYGEYFRKHRDARNAYEAAKGGILRGLLERAKGIPVACDETVRRAAEAIEQMEREQLAAQEALDSYDATRQHLDHQCEVSLRRFRDENAGIRTTPAPNYFADFPTLDDQANRGEVQSMSDRLQFHRRHLLDLQAISARIKQEGPARVTELASRFDKFVDEHSQRVDEQTKKDDRLGLEGETPARELPGRTEEVGDLDTAGGHGQLGEETAAGKHASQDDDPPAMEVGA